MFVFVRFVVSVPHQQITDAKEALGPAAREHAADDQGQ